MTAKVHRLVPRAPAFPPEPESHVRLAVLQKPRVRGDCVDGPRPCTWTECRHHIASEPPAMPPIGDEIPSPPDSCTLDVADRGRHTLEEIGAILGVTREAVRQTEEKALHRLEKRFPELREMIHGWTHTEATAPDAGLGDIGLGFRRAVNRAADRIVPAAERGSKALRVKGPKP